MYKRQGGTTAPAGGGGLEGGADGGGFGAGGRGAAGGSDGGMGGSDPGPGYRRAFVTAASFTGAMGGLDGADEACDDAAANLGGGGWRAWLSDGSAVADQRLSDVGPWLSLDGTTTIATSLSDLANGPTNPLQEDELGLPVTGQAWTGTSYNGNAVASADHCVGWQSPNGGQYGLVGGIGELGVGFTDFDSKACSQPAHLYCLEQ